jgi:hypothetical protein
MLHIHILFCYNMHMFYYILKYIVCYIYAYISSHSYDDFPMVIIAFNPLKRTSYFRGGKSMKIQYNSYGHNAYSY